MKRSGVLSLCLALLLLLSSCAEVSTGDVSVGTDTAAESDIGSETEAEKEDPYPTVKYSVKGGFAEKGTLLSLSLSEISPSDAYIVYTLDGSEPTAEGTVFTEDIKLDSECIIVRSAVFSADGVQLGRIKTNTYLTSEQGRYDTYVVSLVTDGSNLYGRDGIIDNYQLSGKEGERPCHVEIFTEDGAELISQDAGIRIFGGSSRGLAQKSFRLVARRDGYYDELKYNGNGSFDAALFDGRLVEAGENKGQVLDRYDRFILRNGGNDSLHATAADQTDMTLTRDAIANGMIKEYAPGVAYQASRFVVVYLNGEYYGILDMKEDINDDYMRNVYGLDKELVTVIKSELDTARHCDRHDNGGSCRYCGVWFYYEVDDGAESELDEWASVYNKAIKALAGSDADKKAAFSEISEVLDIESFLSYCAVSLYCCNTDWPHNNVRLWRYTGDPIEGNEYSDGKWRFSTRDMDFCFGRYKCALSSDLYSVADADTLFYTLGNYIDGKFSLKSGNYPDSLGLQALLALCLTDDGARADFEALCRELASENAQKFLISMMEDYTDSIADEMDHHIAKWKNNIKSNYKSWKKASNAMEDWAEERPSYFLSDLEAILPHFE